MAVPEPKHLLIVRSHFQSHPSAGPVVRAMEPLSPYSWARGLLTPTILASLAPTFSSHSLNSLGQDFWWWCGVGGICAVVNLCFTPAAQCGGITVQTPLSLTYFSCFGACTRPLLPCILARNTWLQQSNLLMGL